MPVKFNHVTKHGKLQIAPSISIAFEDEGAEAYFVAAGFAEETDEEPVMTFPEGSVTVDPETIFGTGDQRGQKVLAAEQEG